MTTPEDATGHEDKMLRARPQLHHTGGFFVCVMRKKHSTIKPVQEFITDKKKSALQLQKTSHKTTTTPPFAYNQKLELQIRKLIKTTYGIAIDLDKYALIE